MNESMAGGDFVGGGGLELGILALDWKGNEPGTTCGGGATPEQSKATASSRNGLPAAGSGVWPDFSGT